MIALCQSEDSINEVFFFRTATVFWPPAREGYDINHNLYKHSEDLTSDKWLSVSSRDLTQWSEE